jgi:heterodisulfide reductase subunit A-like polyferredoxin
MVLAACACCNFDQVCYSCSDRRVHCKSNLFDSCQLDVVCYEFVNIREHCAWVHWRQPQEATSKARSLINAGLANTRDHQGITDHTLDRAIVTVDRQRCRGCGTCVSVCQFEAVALCENSPGILIAQVDDISCKGCGICAAHCPSGALSQIGCGDNHITASLEAILS